jgi:hypothetical protein
MDKQETGFSSSVWGIPGAIPGRPLPFPSLLELLEHWDVELGPAGRDEHGVYVSILPRREERRGPSSQGASRK